MPNLLPAEYGDLFLTFFFVYVRVTTMVFVMPVLSNETVFTPIRVGISFWIAVVLMSPYLGMNAAEQPASLPIAQAELHGLIDFSLALVCEILIGFVLGFIGQVLLVAISISGEVIGQQAGFSAASVLDPVTGQDEFLMATLKLWMATILFMVIGGIEKGLNVLARSFDVVMPGAGFAAKQLGDVGLRVFNVHALGDLMYLFGVQIAAPMIAAMVLISVAEAFIARTVPQLNILVVGFAVRISIGLLLLHNMMSFTVEKFYDHMNSYSHFAFAALSHLR